jgi:hypothetical protein
MTTMVKTKRHTVICMLSYYLVTETNIMHILVYEYNCKNPYTRAVRKLLGHFEYLRTGVVALM